jgi:transcriptional regulator with XRE-family HTH domain
MTLINIAEATGISKSTLSRLETGKRRPTLELLLALSRTYRVPLDDLLGAPDVGDPRIRLKPGRVKGPNGHPAHQSARGDAGLEDRHPDHKVNAEPRAHDGHEWIYVLAGHLRLVLGDQDWVLKPGEVAEFDTHVPHWFGSTGHEPVEILSIFARPGESMHVRTPPPNSRS